MKMLFLAEEMVKLDPVDENFATIALCYQKLNNDDHTVIFYKKASGIASDNTEAYNG